MNRTRLKHLAEWAVALLFAAVAIWIAWQARSYLFVLLAPALLWLKFKSQPTGPANWPPAWPAPDRCRVLRIGKPRLSKSTGQWAYPLEVIEQINAAHTAGATHMLKELIEQAMEKLITSVTARMQPNEAAAVGETIRGLLHLVEAEAVNRGGPALIKALAAKHPALATAISSIPELAGLLG